MRDEAREALRDILPVMVAAVPIGLLFGALCVGKGLSVAEAGLMSLLVFSTLLINARHVLMGASLTPKMGGFSLLQRLGAFYVLTDESWALAERRAMRRPITPAYWFALAPALPIAWLGSFLGDPERLGVDFAFTALFIGLVAAFWRGPVTGFTIAASGMASALTYVAAGAFAGIAAAYAAAGPGEGRA